MQRLGNLTSSQVIVQTPGLVKQLSNGVLYGVYKNPQKLLKSMLVFLEGHGGLLAMLKLQATADVPMPDPGAAVEAKKELGVYLSYNFKFYI